MSDSLSIASQGLLQAERDAVRAASLVAQSANQGGGVSRNGLQVAPIEPREGNSLRIEPGQSAVQVDRIEPGQSQVQVPRVEAGQGLDQQVRGAQSGSSLASLDSNLIQDLSDLRASEQAFSANAQAFSSISETLDASIGSLFDEEN